MKSPRCWSGPNCAHRHCVTGLRAMLYHERIIPIPVKLHSRVIPGQVRHTGFGSAAHKEQTPWPNL